jgi:hypothetical protein
MQRIASPTMVACCGCGATFRALEGPIHRYMTSSPGCWAAFGEVLAREYLDRQLDEVHRLSVDSYAVQHPGQRSAQSIQSVAVHLCRLCAVIEGGLPMEGTNGLMLKVKKIEHQFRWLSPPSQRPNVTVVDVLAAQNTEAHVRSVRAWAQASWNAWAAHHETVRTWLRSLGFVIKSPPHERVSRYSGGH